MSGTFTERLQERIALATAGKRTSLNKLNDAAGLSAGYLSRLAKGDRKMPGIDLLEPIAAALRVRVDWLQRGVGEVELPSDPPEWERLSEPAKVALWVLAGRGGKPAEVLARVASLPRSAKYEQFLAVAEGRESETPIELPPEYHRALGWLEAKHGRDFTEAAIDVLRSAAHRPERRTIEGLASEIYEAAQGAKGKSAAAAHPAEDEAPVGKPASRKAKA